MEENKLVMVFKNTLGNSFSITVDDPKTDLEEQEIIDAMNLIKSKNIFQPKGYDIAEWRFCQSCGLYCYRIRPCCLMSKR